MKPANYAPIYACVYAQLAEVARSHGYALAAHGSLAADFDLVCIPWVSGVSDPQSVVDEITSRFVIKQVGAPEQKEHGRIAYTISFEFGECRLDLSFMPTAAAHDQGEVQSRERWTVMCGHWQDTTLAIHGERTGHIASGIDEDAAHAIVNAHNQGLPPIAAASTGQEVKL